MSNVKFVYAGINIMLNGLNFFWFRSMVNALRKRYIPLLHVPLWFEGAVLTILS